MPDYSNANGVKVVQTIICYILNDEAKIWEAIQAPGAVRLPGYDFLPQGNKRLALIGDAVLRLALVENSYAAGIYKGPAQQRISTVASNANLAIVGRSHGIEEVINPAGGTMAISDGTIADTVEAILGAVYLDGGLAAVTRVMETLELL